MFFLSGVTALLWCTLWSCTRAHSKMYGMVYDMVYKSNVSHGSTTLSPSRFPNHALCIVSGWSLKAPAYHPQERVASGNEEANCEGCSFRRVPGR